MNRFPPCMALLFAMVFSAGLSGQAETEKPDASKLLPPSTLFYAEVTDTAAVIDLLTGALLQKYYDAPPFRAAWQTSEAKEFFDTVAYVEEQVGSDWRTILRTITDGGIYFAIDPVTQGGMILLHTSDEQVRDRFVESLVRRARETAKTKSDPDPIEEFHYAAHRGYKFEKGGIIGFGPWTMICNRQSAAQWVLDAYSKPGGVSLEGDPVFTQARETQSSGSAGWSYLRFDTLRAFGVGRSLFIGRHDNPLLEILAGGVIDALFQAPYVTSQLEVRESQIGMEWSVPFDASKITSRRAFFFSPEGEGAAPKPIRPDGTILSWTIYRDLSALWHAAPDLFDDNVATRMAQADSTLSQFFSGRSFSSQILTRIDPRMQLLVVRREFDTMQNAPAVKLPAAALVLRIHDPETTRDYLQLGFQTAISLINIGASMNGQPTLMIHSENRDGFTLASSRYLAMAAPAMGSQHEAPIYENFSPSMAIVGDRVVLSSTKQLALQLAELILDGQGDGERKENTLIDLDMESAVDALRDNYEQLVAQNMIEEGVDEDTAKATIHFVLDFLSAVQNGRLSLIANEKTLRLKMEVNLRDTESGEQTP